MTVLLQQAVPVKIQITPMNEKTYTHSKIQTDVVFVQLTSLNLFQCNQLLCFEINTKTV